MQVMAEEDAEREEAYGVLHRLRFWLAWKVAGFVERLLPPRVKAKVIRRAAAVCYAEDDRGFYKRTQSIHDVAHFLESKVIRYR
jgi:hypothetical protein